MYELLDAAGATLCDPLLIILLAVMMMPSGGGSSYVFSGKSPREKATQFIFTVSKHEITALYSLSRPDDAPGGGETRRLSVTTCHTYPSYEHCAPPPRPTADLDAKEPPALRQWLLDADVHYAHGVCCAGSSHLLPRKTASRGLTPHAAAPRRV